ncbi:fimbria/pilus periplasmic chaperone [Salmonella enterica]|uniref:Molecular chaperone n=1 Tax=Salmonella diarizonae TaxID=59204 RepID=A0A5Y1Y9G1_SALDZ|nr:molecular chaperone [Salmonella enterica]EBS3849486.1 molecular chaperone [Salmonella enterica subsp. enterica serovar Java]ECB2071750.1 molecular chaperone [Salmonella enterica subsp. enterica serovar Benin]ECC3914707.1 molecular chaperone [Salmonella enterica subsp. diarizonae]EDX3987478.1 fimbria/pilus periplasmic chaperone [Salmonella enterica subsp. enterica serovar 4,[5],12:b:-]EEE5612317.1 fimbria/pilus periplasmic chaperone [Salmonella enterica subsp. enterica serovar Typhimurium]E
MVRTYLSCLIAVVSVISGMPEAVAQSASLNSQKYGIVLGTSRVIYPTDGRGVSLRVTNPEDYPILVQSQVMNEDKKTEAPFYVTPPLFRLEGRQQNTLRIVRTGGNYPAARESLTWLCVRGIPPKDGDVWAEDKSKSLQTSGGVAMLMQLSINSCIKLLVRPDSLSGNPSDMADKLVWKITGKNLTAANPTPYYMNLDSLSFNGKKLKADYIPPLSEHEFTLPDGSGVRGKVNWTVIGDYGDKSTVRSAEIK